MAKFYIENKISGASLDEYEAESPDDALEVMAHAAGYATYADACKVTGGDESELSVYAL